MAVESKEHLMISGPHKRTNVTQILLHPKPSLLCPITWRRKKRKETFFGMVGSQPPPLVLLSSWMRFVLCEADLRIKWSWCQLMNVVLSKNVTWHAAQLKEMQSTAAFNEHKGGVGGDSPMQFLHFRSFQLGAKSTIRRNMCLVWGLWGLWG